MNLGRHIETCRDVLARAAEIEGKMTLFAPRATNIGQNALKRASATCASLWYELILEDLVVVKKSSEFGSRCQNLLGA